MGLLYLLDFPTGLRYVGMTSNETMAPRLSTHRAAANGGYGAVVSRAWRKHGAPRVRILARASGAFLLDLERRAIRAYGTLVPGGYNVTEGGDACPMSSSVVRAKVSEALKGRRKSPEHRARLAEWHRGRKLSDATRAKMSASHVGLVPTDETRKKLSASLSGRVITESWRAKLSLAAKRRKQRRGDDGKFLGTSK